MLREALQGGVKNGEKQRYVNICTQALRKFRYFSKYCGTNRFTAHSRQKKRTCRQHFYEDWSHRLKYLILYFSAISILKGNEKVFQNYGTHDNELHNEHKDDLPINHLTYPKGVFFMLISKFFESFSANGVRSRY